MGLMPATVVPSKSPINSTIAPMIVMRFYFVNAVSRHDPVKLDIIVKRQMKFERKQLFICGRRLAVFRFIRLLLPKRPIRFASDGICAVSSCMTCAG